MNKNDQKLWTFHQTDNASNLIMGHPRQDMLFKGISKAIKNGKILEIGFGDGYLLRKLSKKYECHGADISIENVEQMKKDVPGVMFNLIDVDGKLPYEDGYFDSFIASEVLEHMTDEELSLCLHEIERILKPGGYGFITVPFKENLKENECYCPNCGEKFHKWGHKQVWNDKFIIKAFTNFKICKIKTFFVPYRGNSLFEYFIGYLMFVARNFLDLFVDVSGKSYLIIIRK